MFERVVGATVYTLPTCGIAPFAQGASRNVSPSKDPNSNGPLAPTANGGPNNLGHGEGPNGPKAIAAWARSGGGLGLGGEQLSRVLV